MPVLCGGVTGMPESIQSDCYIYQNNLWDWLTDLVTLNSGDGDGSGEGKSDTFRKISYLIDIFQKTNIFVRELLELHTDRSSSTECLGYVSPTDVTFEQNLTAILVF